MGGAKTHLSETGEEGYPDLITHVLTTLSTTPDDVMGPPIPQEFAGRDLLPGPHVLDAGDVDAELLVTAQSRHQIEVVGLLSANSGWQSRAATGYG